MNYMFPFRLIPQGSKIVLFGVGDVGKDFYLQLRELGNYYTLVAWTATSLAGYELAPPFAYLESIPSLDFDYMVLAVREKRTAAEVTELCTALGIPGEKLIWSGRYTFGAEVYPTDRSLMLRNLPFYMDIAEERAASDTEFGMREFYASYSELGIAGMRNTDERVALYHVAELLTKNDTVLDIGCNCGFLSLSIAPFVKHVRGVDVVPQQIRIANMAKDAAHVQNAEFLCKNYFGSEEPQNEKYSAIFAMAVHAIVVKDNFTEEKFVNRLLSLLEENGHLFFESTTLKRGAALYNRLCAIFKDRGMETVLRRTSLSGGGERMVTVMKRKPPIR